MTEENKKMREALASIVQKIEKSKADMSGSPDKMRDEIMTSMYDALGYVMKYVYAVEDQLWNYQSNHSKGHLPPIKGAGKMQNVLDTLGMDTDYEVYKPMVSVASTKKGSVFTCDMEGRSE